MSILVFDIETVPDTQAGRQLHDLPDTLSDADVAEALFALRRQTGQGDFLRLHMQRIVAISLVLQSRDKFCVWSLGEEKSSEKELIQRFFDGFKEIAENLKEGFPTIVSWNGAGFDLPVLHYRSLIHGIQAPDYWENGDKNNSFRYNNYLSRYHNRHLDLMDVLSAYQARASAPLNDIAALMGLPGKMGMSGNYVWDYFQKGRIKEIRDYCETDVFNTYLVYLRFEYIRGNLSKINYQNAREIAQNWLKKQTAQHWQAFLSEWKENVA